MPSPVQARLGAVLFHFEPPRVVNGRFWEPAPARCARLTLGRSKFISQRNPTVKVLPTFQRSDIDSACFHPPSQPLLSQNLDLRLDLRPGWYSSQSSLVRPRSCSPAPRPSSRWKTSRSPPSFISLAFQHLAQAACLCRLHHGTVLFVYK